MRSGRHIGLVAVLASIAVAACAPAAPGASRAVEPSGQQATQQAGPRGTLRMALDREPDYLSPKFLGGSGNGEYQWIFNSTLVVRGLSGAPTPLLAREIPTQANGSWVVNPDGTMVTTYQLRENAAWHDGTPLTAGDFAFAFQVYTDKDLPIPNQQPNPETMMSAVEAKDDHTIVIFWKQPYINANVLGFQSLNPLPRHQLEQRYLTNRTSFAIGEEWTTGYIGTGPFRVDHWNQGSNILAKANLSWVLGPPKIDTIDIRFVPDNNTKLANLLAGEVDMITSPGARAPEAAIARDRWAGTNEGYIKAWVTRTSYVEFQFRDFPGAQKAVQDVRVRQALIHATDRDGLAEIINLGFGTAADAFVAPTDVLFPDVDRAVMKYPYDLNRARALLADAGYRAPSPDGLAVNAAGQTLDIELWTTSDQEKLGTITANNWSGSGAKTSVFVIPSARARDNELRTSFPAAANNGRTIGPDNWVWNSDNLPTPENKWTGSNRGSFVDTEIDRLQNIRTSSLDPKERDQATIAELKRMTELVGAQPLIYSIEVIVARSNVRGPEGNYGPQEGITWNVQDWTVS
jgi:peptide/nickel transport system substrate-binding protein